MLIGLLFYIQVEWLKFKNIPKLLLKYFNAYLVSVYITEETDKL